MAQAILHTRHLSLLSLVCIASSFVIIDGPLLQRASTVELATLKTNITLKLPLVAELPKGFSGLYEQHQFWSSKLAYDVCLDFSHNRPIAVPEAGCEGSCRMTVRAPAVVKSNCSSKTWPITLEMLRDMNSTWGPWKGYSVENGYAVALNPMFYVSLAPAVLEETREAARLTVGFASWYDLRGEYVETTYNLVAATLEYDIIIEISNNTHMTPAVLEAVNNTHTPSIESGRISTIGAFTQWVGMMVDANASAVLYAPRRSNALPGGQAVYRRQPSTFNIEVLKHFNFSSEEHSPNDLSIIDLTPSITFKYNELMLRGAVAAHRQISESWLTQDVDNGVPVNQTVSAVQTLTQPVFKSDLRWYACATVFEIMTVLLISPLFWGFWNLGLQANSVAIRYRPCF